MLCDGKYRRAALPPQSFSSPLPPPIIFLKPTPTHDDDEHRTQLRPPSGPSSTPRTRSRKASKRNHGFPAPWGRFINDKNAALCSLDALDLLTQLLQCAVVCCACRCVDVYVYDL